MTQRRRSSGSFLCLRDGDVHSGRSLCFDLPKQRLLLTRLPAPPPQLRLDPQQPAERLHEDQRLPPLLALRHPPRDPQRGRCRRLVSSCLWLHTAAPPRPRRRDTTRQTAPHHRRGSKQGRVLSACFTSLSLHFFFLIPDTHASWSRVARGGRGGGSLLYWIPVKLWESTHQLEWKLLFAAIWLSHVTELKSLLSPRRLITLELRAKQSDVTLECMTSSPAEGHRGHALLFGGSRVGLCLSVLQCVVRTSRCTRGCRRCIHLESSGCTPPVVGC